MPIGAFWVASWYWNRLAGKQFGIAIAGLIVPSIFWLLGSFMAFIVGSLTLGAGMVVFWLYAVSRAWPALKRLKTAPPRPPSAVAFYLLIVPVAVLLIQLPAVPRAIESSRNRAIRNRALLIADIEQYRAANGRYPESLFSLHPDHYKPGVIGIKEYLYEPSGDAPSRRQTSLLTAAGMSREPGVASLAWRGRPVTASFLLSRSASSASRARSNTADRTETQSLRLLSVST